MPNKKITQLVNKTSILSTDLFPIGDATTGQLYKKTVAELQAAIGGAVISVNGKVGTVVLTTDDVAEAVSPTNLYFTNTRARASVSATTPLAYNSSTGVFSIPAATTSANGYLTSTDWTTFNGKENVLTFSSPLVRTSNTISMPAATTSVNGYLSSTDWNTFNNKQGTLTLTVTGSSGASTLVGTTLNIPTYTLAGLGGIGASFLSGGTGITYNSGTGVIATTITQYTDALARASLSFTAGSGAYNSTTGVITIPTNTSQLTNGASFITLGSLSGGTGISYNSTTGAISSTITQYTDALARGAISLTTTGTSGASTYNSTTGVLNIPNYGSALSGYLPLTGGTLTGALTVATTSYSNLLLNGTNATGWGNNIAFQSEGTTFGYIGSIGSLLGNTTKDMTIWATAGNGFRVYTNGNNLRLTIDSTGVATFSSSVQGSFFKSTNGTVETVLSYSSTPAGVVGTLTNHPLEIYTNGSAKATFTSSGNFGLGVTPNSWLNWKALQIAGNAILAGYSNNTILGNNWYYDGTDRYTSNGFSTIYQQYSGNHAWYNAPSSTAGSTISFTQAMTLTNGGNLLVGTTTDSGYKLDVNGTGRFSGDVAVNSTTVSINSSSYPKIRLNDTNTGGGIYYWQSIVGKIRLVDDVAGAERFSISSTGAATFSSSVSTGGSQENQLLISRTSSKVWNITSDSSGFYLKNNTDSVLPIYITNAGNVGIGTTSPSRKLHVIGDFAVNGASGQYYGVNIGGGEGSNPYVLIGDWHNSSATLSWDSTNRFLRIDSQYSTSGAPIVFSGNDGASEYMRITSGGNVGIGTTTDSGYKLDVNGTGRFTNTSDHNLILNSTGRFSSLDLSNNGTLKAQVFWDNTASNINITSGSATALTLTANTGAATFSSSVTAGGIVQAGSYFYNSFSATGVYNAYFQNTSATGYGLFSQGGSSGKNALTIKSYGGTDYLTVDGGTGEATFASNTIIKGSNALVLNNSDNTNNYSLNNGGASGVGNGILIFIQSTSGERARFTAAGNLLLGTATDNGERLYVSGAIRATGTITANSDIRLKKNLERIENALEKVGQISGYTYNTIYDDKRHGGVIAQEIDEVFPEIVNKGNDGLLGVEYGNISALLIEALKELKEKNTALEARLQALEK